MSTQFSVIVTCYNFADYLPDCLNSILRQRYSADDCEVVCVDDGSTDATPDILRGYQKKMGHIRSIRIENSGLEKACNAGIRETCFEKILRVDADDILAEDYLSTMDAAIHERPDFDFYYCKNYIEYYSKDEMVPKELPDFDKEEIFERGDFFATGTVYNRSDLKSVGFFPEKIKNCGLENYAVILALLSQGKRGLAVPNASFYYRRHRTNMSTMKRAAIVEYGKKLLKQYERMFKTNAYHPHGLRLETDGAKQ